MHDGDKYANIYNMKNTRPISWIKAARRDFEEFPEDVQVDVLSALTIAAEGGKSDNTKPFKGVEGGVFEIVFKHRGDAFRVLYAVKNRSGYLGDPCIPEKIQDRDQNTSIGN